MPVSRTRLLEYPWCLLHPASSHRDPFFFHSDLTDPSNAAQGRDQGPNPFPLIKSNNTPRLSQSVRNVKFSLLVCQRFVTVGQQLVPRLSAIPFSLNWPLGRFSLFIAMFVMVCHPLAICFKVLLLHSLEAST